MSRHYNVTHPERVAGGYRRRLEARGLSKAPAMIDLETLQRRQANRIKATCTLGDEHDKHVCNGQPWYVGVGVETNTPGEQLLRDIFTG